MSEYKTIEREELKEWMNEDKDFILIDTLGAESYAENHLPNAKMADAHEDGFVERVKDIASEDDNIVVYCANFDCNLSNKAANDLVEAGFENVYDYEGGIEDWKESYELVKPGNSSKEEESKQTCKYC